MQHLSRKTLLTSKEVFVVVTWLAVLSNNPKALGTFAFHPTLQSLSIALFAFGASQGNCNKQVLCFVRHSHSSANIKSHNQESRSAQASADHPWSGISVYLHWSNYYHQEEGLTPVPAFYYMARDIWNNCHSMDGTSRFIV